MSYPKIPDLNLFRGKRGNRQNFISRIEKQSLNILSKDKTKAQLDKIKNELYLDNYKANLKHFISPTKYKNKAEQYFKEKPNNEEIYLKAIQFPRSNRYCSNCFDKKYLSIRKQCQCQIQMKIPQIHRYKSQFQLFKRQAKEYHKKGQDQIKNDVPHLIRQQREREDTISNDLILTQSSESPLQLNFSRQQISHNANTNRNIVQTINNRIIPDSSYFYRNITNKQKYLQNLSLKMEDSRPLLIDLQPLSQAKREYINQSHWIIDRLDQIIRSNSP